MFDIINYDKTEYDLKVAKLVTDYIELARDLVQQLAKDAIPQVMGRKKIKKEVSSQNTIKR